MQPGAKGAYILKDSPAPDIILLANGSEVSTLMAGAQKLEEKGLKVRVVSAPRKDCSGNNPKNTSKSIASQCAGVRAYCSLPVTLQGLAGPKGKVFGLDQFRLLRPVQGMDEKFGFTEITGETGGEMLGK